MNFNHLCYFVAVAKYESITKAADALHMSQPSITAAIKDLEKEFSLRLFDRIGNKITLTSSGKKFLNLANDLIRDFDNFSKKASELNTQNHSTLKLGVPAVLGSFYLKRITPAFELANPNINLKIEEVPTLVGATRIHDSKLDLLIGISDNECYPNCSSSTIFETELMLAVSKDHPLAGQKTVTNHMIADLPFVLISRGSYIYKSVTRSFAGNSINIVLSSNQVSTIKYMLMNANAVTILYKEVFENDPDICCIPFETPKYANVSIFWHRNSYLTTPMKTLITYLMQSTKENL